MSRSLLCVALGLFLPAAVQEPQDSLPTPAGILASMTWLEGSWRGTVDKNVFESCYTSPEGGEILSCSKEIAGGRAIFYELERFFVRGDELILVPHPGGKPSTDVFPLADWDPDARKATFANPEHDFPKTLTYHRAAADRLVITLTGDEGGKPRTETYDLKRKSS